jgi:hypothetical protein
MRYLCEISGLGGYQAEIPPDFDSDALYWWRPHRRRCACKDGRLAYAGCGCANSNGEQRLAPQSGRSRIEMLEIVDQRPRRTSLRERRRFSHRIINDLRLGSTVQHRRWPVPVITSIQRMSPALGSSVWSSIWSTRSRYLYGERITLITYKVRWREVKDTETTKPGWAGLCARQLTSALFVLD